MMKKVLFGVAMALLASVSVGTLQSCKDDVSDLKTQTSFDLAQLERDLNDKSKMLQAQIDNNRGNISKIFGLLGYYAEVSWVQGKLDELKGRLENYAGNLQQQITDNKNNLQGQIDAQNNKLITLNQSLSGAWGEIRALQAKDAFLVEQILGALRSIDDLDTKYGNLNDQINGEGGLKDKIDALETALGDWDEAKFNQLEGRVQANEAAINLINETLDGVKSDIVDINDQLNANSESIENLKYKMMLLKREVSQLKEDLNELKNDVALLTTRVENIEKQLTDLTNLFNNNVSGILIQGVYSPVFGDFSLPIGVKSNILFNWYGFNNRGEGFVFPNSGKEYSANGDPAVNLGGGDYCTIQDGIYPSEVSLGKVYVTLNPAGSLFSNVPVTIQNSRGEPLKLKAINLNESDYLLKHGWTRAEGDKTIENKLYEAEVVLNADDEEALDQVRINIDDKLESSMKDAIKDPSKHTAVALMKALYNQFNGMLTAYALNYSWDVEMLSDPEYSPKSYSILSQYDLAVATAHPLGYNFLEGKGSSKHLPTIGALDNIISNLKDKVSIKIEPLADGAIKVDLSKVEVSVSTDDVNLMMVIPDIAIINGTAVEGTYDLVLSSKAKPENQTAKEFAEQELGNKYDENKTYEYQQITGLSTLDKAIQKGIKEGLKNAGVQISNDITKQINDNIIAKINAELKTQIDNVIDDLANQFEPYFNKANRAFDIYNKIANKVNKFLKNPNAYLQVTALYSMGDDLGFVSGKLEDPSVYNGSDAFSIYLTSYTGELIVPAYKKYVAVTGKVVDGQVQPIDVTNSINSGDLNKVLDGNQIRVEVPVAGFTSGDVYELTYQAVDYRGYTSTRKMYVQVNK